MKNRKLVITHNIQQDLVEKVKEVIPDWEIIVGRDRDIWENHIEDAEIIAGWKKGIEKECLHENSKLRWLQSWSAGVNSMPLEEIENRNVILTSANGVHAFPISETIFALILGLTRKIHSYVRNQQTKTWDHANLNLEIHGKTIGILGIGAIGKETAKIAKAFGMHVIGIRHSSKEEENVDEMYTTEQLNEVLPRCDYVVVTLPLTKDTFHLFDSEQFQLMKDAAFFINIGRGEIVNEEALTYALVNEQIGGAGLDVFEKEPLPESSVLWELDNVIITPHTAGSTEHYAKRLFEEIFIPNLKDYLAGKTPSINVVDYKKGY
ncbi:phosphoglycerate dehydrogenase-like enzyme [Evansella vedderi]|uniref:Phosphoglycerate dehydrogenase-like enzyme n=1 Tax=Evansella vedderi TaxID=38282 RepID=A0ABU0A023_9BACI|nr:D-2-hydroxyacid dehydrogenase [Evansella vedderi]MDQ0256844.1 phosphoglycerate dehydrogenase-like enzyme [Evansella vedderi]